jgi:predicted RNA-binding protein with PIN domain
VTVRDDPVLEATELLTIPETLLVPLLDAAAAVLRELDTVDFPPVLRPLASFGKQGLTTSPARQQLRRALDVDRGFRDRAVAEFCARPEVEGALALWDPRQALRRVDEAAERSDLALLASVLYAARPEGWMFGLGVVCSTFDRQRLEKEAHDDAKARQLQLATLDEARRRAEESCDRARQDVARLEEQLGAERRARREREGKAERAIDAARGTRAEADAVVAKARAAADEAEGRLEREASRARDAEREVRELRRELAARDEAARPGPAPSAAFADAARDAQRLAAALDALTQSANSPPANPSRGESRAGGARPAGSGPRSGEPSAGAGAGTGSVRRTRVPRPPGREEDSVAGLDAMLRTRGVALVVDGYNVSMRGWGDAAPATQRDGLLGALERLHLRLRCDVIVVFDGSDVEAIPGRRRAGVRIVFSAADEEADPVVVRQVEALPSARPALVASSDRWVQDHAREVGATVVSADTLLGLLRQ